MWRPPHLTVWRRPKSLQYPEWTLRPSRLQHDPFGVSSTFNSEDFQRFREESNISSLEYFKVKPNTIPGQAL